MSTLSLLFYCLLALSAVLAQCPAPSILSPTNNQNLDGTYGAVRFTGTIPTSRDASCTQIRFYRANDNFLLSVLDAGSSAETFERNIGGLDPGPMSVYALTTGQNGATPSARSNTVSFNIEQACPQPVNTVPSNRAILSTRRFTLYGTTGCRYINAFINNRLVGSVVADATGQYQLASGNALPDGDYVLRIVAYRSLGGPTSQFAQSQFSVASIEPYSTADLARRRRLSARDVCAAHEDLCLMRTAGSRRSSYKCVADLDSNLERCGSCEGPDCSALPNVDEVACVKGRCVVHTCRKGYALVGRSCV